MPYLPRDKMKTVDKQTSNGYTKWTKTTPHSEKRQCLEKEGGGDTLIFSIFLNVYFAKDESFSPNTTRVCNEKKLKIVINR